MMLLGCGCRCISPMEKCESKNVVQKFRFPFWPLLFVGIYNSVSIGDEMQGRTLADSHWEACGKRGRCLMKINR